MAKVRPATRYGSGNGSESNPEALKIPTIPSPDVVANFHTNSDLDANQNSQHHTLGPGNTQASPGDHNHDGSTSPLLLSGVTLTGSRGGNAALTSLIAALVRLGATDNTTS